MKIEVTCPKCEGQLYCDEMFQLSKNDLDTNMVICEDCDASFNLTLETNFSEV